MEPKTLLTRTSLNWNDLKKLGAWHGSARAWHPNESIADYFKNLRAPSRAYPHSYARAAQTYKFRDWLMEHKPEIASAMGLTCTDVNDFTGE
jgi:hypothetical protein